MRGPSNRFSSENTEVLRTHIFHGILQTNHTEFFRLIARRFPASGGQENVTVHVERDFGLTLADNVVRLGMNELENLVVVSVEQVFKTAIKVTERSQIREMTN